MSVKRMKPWHLSVRHRSRGVGIVEVLVALVVIGVGMLGVASLYVISLQAKTSAGARMQAVNLAYDMADRIRANRNAGNAYALSSSATLSAPTTSCAGSSATNCSPAQMAAEDLYQWSQMVQGRDGSIIRGTNGLPGTVTRQITVSGSNPTTYVIQLTWGEPSSGGTTQSYQLEVRI
jgi:type IV pilus assembly protein PilV